ncbi:CHAT domain-containing protein [Streptomyces sp. NPDC056257]|uniref:CHAT domain-containing protein n=1 Tax=Streptomyces sp. NPDC056257 TaxID=3345765 RepID=UPI0035DC50CC
MRFTAYDRALVLAGRMARDRRLPLRGGLSTRGTRWTAARIDARLERSEGLPARLQREMLELDGFLGGLSIADSKAPGNAGPSWVRAMLIRTTDRPWERGELPPRDRHLARLYELLGREYVRCADWSTASECFIGAALHWGAPRHKRRTYAQMVVLMMKRGDHAAALDGLEVLQGATHGPSAAFHRIAARILDPAPVLDVHATEGIERVRELGIIPYTYLVSCLAERLAADAQPERALGLLTTALARLAADRADDWLVGELEQAAAGIWTSLERYEEGLALALAAWAKLDAQRYRACSHTQRLSLWKNFGPTRRAALVSAVALGDERTVAELIESCRLQSLLGAEVEIDDDEKLAESGLEARTALADDGTEDTDGGDGGGAGRTVTPAPAAEGEPGTAGGKNLVVSSAVFTAYEDALNSTLLHFPEPVSYQGEARLLPHYRAALPPKEARRLAARPLDDALPEGVFWATHIEDGLLFWFLARDGRPAGFGVQDLREFDRIKPVLLGLAGHSQSSERKTWSLFPYKRGPGDFYEPFTQLRSWRSAEEQIITRTIGQLLPPPLVDALQRSGADEPLRLTISAARELTCVPWAITMVPGTEERLIEKAVLRMWTSTPTQLRRASRDLRLPPGAPVPFLLACDNPDGSLRERRADSVVNGAAALLTVSGPDGPGTKDALLAALHEIGPSTHGVFFYRGHGVHDSDPAWSALPLAEETYVQSGELFGAFDDGTPYLPMPTRVILSCCSSSSASALGGEGMGLAAGVIHSGADQVIATSLDIRDASFTEAFEDLLVRGMLDGQRTGDHADLLRRLQLRMLTEWKVFSVRGEDLDGEEIRDPHPIIWASFQAY